MTPERWQQVRAIFDQVVECDLASRAEFIRKRCGSDQGLQREVESLLASDQETGPVLKSPLETPACAAAASNPTVSLSALNDSFGPYRPIRVLGEGGMGTVYLARQQHPIRREVALKVVKLGMDSRQVMERFESERQALALMEYPNVARVLDAGTSERGRPYFVMEYVDGVPITQYCNQKVLGTRERLQLFIQVCNALQHAHKKGIIHRDVKPSNILVTEVDAKPVPKVIDFGIARATGQLSAEGETFTLAGQIVGTPEYMSPEQASLDSRDIDTGTDVYSLGVVLYELLVGVLPLDLKALRRISLDHVLHGIRETPLPKPTARITQMGAAAEEMARQRGTDPNQLKRDLRGDLDWIVMKAIEKDRLCRYPSASEFAADIVRYLKSEPVLAGPPDAAYRMRKFVTRHKRPVAAAAAIVLASVAGILTTAWEAHVAGQQRAAAISGRAEAEKQRARAEQHAMEAARQRDAALAASNRAAGSERTATRERDRALGAEQSTRTERDRAVAAEGRAQQERNTAIEEKGRADNEAAIAKAVNDFLRNDLLAQASATSQAGLGLTPDPGITVRTALDRAAGRIAGKFDAQPLVEASIRLTMGNTYNDLGQYGMAQRELERALDLRRQALGDEHPETLTAMIDLGAAYLTQGEDAKAEPLAVKALEVARRVLGEEHPRTLSAMSDLGVIYMNERKWDQAESLFTKAFQGHRRVLGEEHPDTLNVMTNLGHVNHRQRRFTQAELFYTKALEVRRRVLREEHPDTLKAVNVLGAFYWGQGNFERAEPLLTKALEVRRQVLGDEHPSTLTAMNNVGILYSDEGKYAQAEPLLRKVLDRRRLTVGEEDLRTLASMNNLGIAYGNQSKYAEAELLLTKVLEVRRRVQGPQHPDTTNAMSALGGIWLREQKYARAEPLLREALSNYEKLPESWERYRAQGRLGESLAGQRKYADAEPLMLSGYRGIIQREGAAPIGSRSELGRAGDRIVQLYQDWEKPEQAAEWRSKLQTRNAVATRQ